MDNTEWKVGGSEIFSSLELTDSSAPSEVGLLNCTEILSQTSQRTIRSMMRGVARRESSQVLCIAIVFCGKMASE